MKTINYEKTKGFFIIQYIDDGEIVEGSINVDESSINIDLKFARKPKNVAKYIEETIVKNKY